MNIKNINKNKNFYFDNDKEDGLKLRDTLLQKITDN